MAEYTKNYLSINDGSRTVLVKSAYTYGGQIMSVTYSVPDGATYSLSRVVQTSETSVAVDITSSGNGESGILLVELVSSTPLARQIISSWTANTANGYTNASQFELINGTNVGSGLPTTGSGAICTVYTDEGGTTVASTIDPTNAQNYAIGDKFFFTEGDGQFYVEISNVTDVTSYVNWTVTSVSAQLSVGIPDKGDGRYNYNVGEVLTIDMSQLHADNAGKDIQATVTSVYPDRNYGYQFNHQVLYDRYDRRMYVRIFNEDGTIENVDFDGVTYQKSPLPEPTVANGFTRVSSTELLFNYSNPALRILSVTADPLVISSTSIYQNSIRVITQGDIEYAVTYQFNISFVDVLGAVINDLVNVNIPDPGGTGDDWGWPSYIEWTGTPYFLDENYHVAVYTAQDLTAMGISTGATISRIGFPFHLSSGQGGNVTNEDVEGGFVLAASIISFVGSSITSDYVFENLVVNDNFDTNVLNVSTQQIQGVVETYNSQRYVFFPISHYHWNGSDNILVSYWMNGANPLNGGYNGGYVETGQPSIQEVLGVSSFSQWRGTEGVAGEKVALAFTTLRN